MTRTKLFTHTLLAGFALFNVATAPQANAEYVTITRGSNGAATIVKADKIPVDAQTQPNSPSHSFPKLVTKGPHGAVTLSTKSRSMKSEVSVSVPNVITRGPNGAAVIAQ